MLLCRLPVLGSRLAGRLRCGHSAMMACGWGRDASVVLDLASEFDVGEVGARRWVGWATRVGIR